MTLPEYIETNNIRTSVNVLNGGLVLTTRRGNCDRRRPNPAMIRVNWTRGLISPHDNLMELGEMALSVQEVPDMYYREWAANPAPIAGMPRTEELYHKCFAAEAMLINFLCSSWKYLKPYRELLGIIKKELEFRPKLIEELINENP